MRILAPQRTARVQLDRLSICERAKVRGRAEVMTSLAEAFGFGLVVACLGAGRRIGRDPAAPSIAKASRRPHPGRAPSRPPAPQYIRDRIDELGRALRRPRRNRRPLDRRRLGDRLEGRRALSAAERQQIVGVDHRARRGRQRPGRLDDKVTLTRDDLTLFHQPIAALILQERKLHDDARRPDVQGDHDQRQYRQRQADALGRRARGGARDDRRQASRRDPLLQWRARCCRARSRA